MSPQLACPANNKNQLITCSINYDAAGNMIANGAATFAFDAENRLLTAGGVSYVYDGDGKRVKKSSGTLYWTGMGNDTLAESDLAATMQKEYIYFNGKRVARRDLPGTPSVKYYFSDHLGSASVITNAAGAMPPLEESDYYPYGGEIAVTGGDPNTYKFTGKERDSESGLDNFGARYNASTMGRFMSPDPVMVSWRRMVSPQIWNSYSYAGNNPLRFVDPSGEELIQLGQHTDDEIKKRTKEINQALKNKDLTKDQKSALKSERNTLSLEKQGNQVVGNLLSKLDQTGQRNGLQLSNFTLSTDTKNDFAGAATPEAMQKLLNDQAFVIQNNKQFGGTIYIRTEPETE
jgi:RHS repeat-associated protein